jgi:hypothetical protein
VQGGQNDRQSGLGHPGTRRHRLGEGHEALVRRELADERVENGTVHDDRRNRSVPPAAW